MKRKVSFITFGCKMNQAESQAMAEKLSPHFDIVFEEKMGKSDIYVLNTCAVTSEAERKVRQTIRRLKKSNENSKIIATGCYSVSDPEELKKVGADLVLGNLEKKQIDRLLCEEGIYSDKHFWFHNEKYDILVPNEPYGDRTRIFLPIEEGCINSCTFCKIRFLRGLKIVSLPTEEVIKSIEKFIEKGYKEIVLTGTNLGYYGMDNSETLEELLNQIGKSFADKEIRIRITSLYPEIITDNLSTILNSYPIFEKHIHLSIQHFSDKILQSMHRKYNRKMIYTAIENLRKYDSKFSITCDLIVGFPGEDEEDLRILFDSIEELKVLKVHSFRYSLREGTVAAKMQNQIPGNEKKDRLSQMDKIADLSRKNYLNDMLGSRVKVLTESSSKKGLFGYDEYYIPHNVQFHEKKIEKGEFFSTVISSLSKENKGVVSNVL
ncbi:MiaB-like tRNA modifying enzyme [Petrotoga mobilis SJ95]|uniref:MiaB-like tRNA modifying enzyme n=1 Tax=Petrotoga mobilis (strain DSM 10674 / SJ95) TaxID=403833 RepID=A9BFE2_PETMO|nr:MULTISPECIES: tRNA (N(6)-L-threonylcarbamoyladenosine(37)-C(2))-methylthiotransferase MtaB [Petrotoga]MDK2812489.1 threonylcarbamoyladenosine tRNA methylthiotransferase MtaB [Petrotoga sp.]ABX30927.1 MiaB-like tRNA modifying enzyme [Petrotoga mobilis SJ95]PNR92668.1 radical SAM protein [Petrotoga sp. HWHPT.55.6.3]RLL83360.1 hypothetical protein BZ25_07915 [Petrotoga sp. Shatin.DS.tank11.9.2.9.3]RLL90496.1 hypothetical protein CN13_00985 [Petrotoga sp. HKA.pet.4.5]